jgi:hypothetical protein
MASFKQAQVRPFSHRVNPKAMASFKQAQVRPFSPISLPSQEHMLIFSCISPPLSAAACDPVSV